MVFREPGIQSKPACMNCFTSECHGKKQKVGTRGDIIGLHYVPDIENIVKIADCVITVYGLIIGVISKAA